MHLAIQIRGWSERVWRREQQERKEQIDGAGRWQNMLTNISGGRLRREGERGGVRAMTLLQVLVQCGVLLNRWVSKGGGAECVTR